MSVRNRPRLPVHVLALALFLGLWGTAPGEALIYPSGGVTAIDVPNYDPNSGVFVVGSQSSPSDPNAVHHYSRSGLPTGYGPGFTPAGTTIIDVAGMPPQDGKPRAAVLTKTGATYNLGLMILDPNNYTFDSGLPIPDPNAPSTVATGDGNTFYVGDAGNKDIKKFTFAATTFIYAGTVGTAGMTSYASQIAVDSSGNIHYLMPCGTTGSINPAGSTITSYSPASLAYGAGIAVDSSGRVFVAGKDSGSDVFAVRKYPTTGAPRSYQTGYVPGGPGADPFRTAANGYPKVASDGDFLYVAGPNEVRKVSGWTGAYAEFGRTSLTPSPSIYTPYPGNILYRTPDWVSTDPNSPVDRFFVVSNVQDGLTSGAVLEGYNATTGLVDGQFTSRWFANDSPYSTWMAAGPDNLVYTGGQTLHTLSPWTGSYRGPSQSMDPNTPNGGLCMGQTGLRPLYSLHKGDATYNTDVYRWNADTHQWEPYETRPAISDPNSAAGIAVDSTGNVYVANNKGGIYKYTDGGWTLWAPGAATPGHHRIGVNPSGNVHLLNTEGSVTLYDPNGMISASRDFSGSAGTGTWIAFDSSGRILYAATGANAVYRYDSDGNPVNFTRQPESSPTPTLTPTPTPTPVPSTPTPVPSTTPSTVPMPTSTPTPVPSPTPTPYSPPSDPPPLHVDETALQEALNILGITPFDLFLLNKSIELRSMSDPDAVLIGLHFFPKDTYGVVEHLGNLLFEKDPRVVWDAQSGPLSKEMYQKALYTTAIYLQQVLRSQNPDSRGSGSEDGESPLPETRSRASVIEMTLAPGASQGRFTTTFPEGLHDGEPGWRTHCVALLLHRRTKLWERVLVVSDRDGTNERSGVASLLSREAEKAVSITVTDGLSYDWNDTAGVVRIAMAAMTIEIPDGAKAPSPKAHPTGNSGCSFGLPMALLLFVPVIFLGFRR